MPGRLNAAPSGQHRLDEARLAPAIVVLVQRAGAQLQAVVIGAQAGMAAQAPAKGEKEFEARAQGHQLHRYRQAIAFNHPVTQLFGTQGIGLGIKSELRQRCARRGKPLRRNPDKDIHIPFRPQSRHRR
jgi:hypothetical protein